MSSDLMKSVILHIPHASTHISAGVREQFALDAADLERELLRMTDRYTDELFALPGVQALVYPYSRLVADPERFRGDADEPMAARGMGAVYTRTAHGQPLRRPLTQGKREATLQKFYDPHHARLTDMVAEALGVHGHCLILDAHSFPFQPLPCDRDQTQERPDICIGTDPDHTPDHLARRAVNVFEAEGWSVGVDWPYAGALVPIAFYGKNPRVSAIMVEVNRRLYMNEETGEKLADFEEFQAKFQQCLVKIIIPS